MSFSKLFKCWLRDSSCLVRSFLVTRMQEDRPYASTRTFLPEDAIGIRSGWQSLVIVNVHFEPELTLRRLRERLRLITPHWPSYPNVVGIILGEFDICEPEEGRFNVWNQTFTDGDTGKTALFHSLFPHVLECVFAVICCNRFSDIESKRFVSSRLVSRKHNLTTLEGTPLPLGSYVRCQGSIVSSLTYLWLRREIFTATPMSSRILGTGPFRVITRRYVLSFKSRPIKDNSANAFQAGCPNIPAITDTVPTNLARSQTVNYS